MKILYFDCFSGVSGDMMLGALLDLGIDKELFKKELSKLNLDGYRITIEKKLQMGISGTDVTVLLDEECEHEHEHHHKHDHDHDHHEHNHHDHSHESEDLHHHHTERNVEDIYAIIDASQLKASVKDFSKKVFLEIAEAEARVHGKKVNEVHFHEVGAVDSIVDIVGTAICLDILGVDRVYSSPLHDGRGFIKCRHGIIPVPVPAVVEMLKGSGIPVISEDVETELVTPTGMGLIKTLSNGFGKMPDILLEGAGYGHGKRNTGRLNSLRVMFGTGLDSDRKDEIVLLETNIDDTTPEILGYTMERLLENGALDVFHTPVYMKKNRPAFILSVISRLEDEEKLVDIIFRETSSIGVRRDVKQRYVMQRELITVNTGFGDSRVKISSYNGFKKAAPEYEDCREIAKSTGMPIERVYKIVMDKMERLF